MYCFLISSISLFLFPRSILFLLTKLNVLVLPDSNTNKKTTHGFKHVVTMRANAVCVDAINFFSEFLCCRTSLFYTHVSFFYKRHDDDVSKASCLVLLFFESLQIVVKVTSLIKPCRHGLTQRIGEKLILVAPCN